MATVRATTGFPISSASTWHQQVHVQPPFSGPPPLPQGWAVNSQQWQAGYWQRNPAYNQVQQQYPKGPYIPWIPGQAWAAAQSQDQSFNPYKKQIKPPSAEYMATALVDNPLGLTGMIPVDKLHHTNGTPITPWIWNPRGLVEDKEEDDNPNDTQSSDTGQKGEQFIAAEYRDYRGRPYAAPQIRGPVPSRKDNSSVDSSQEPSPSHTRRSLSQSSSIPSRSGPPLARHATEPILASTSNPLSTSQRPSSSASTSSTASSATIRPEGFLSQQPLQPTFSPGIIRTPESYSRRVSNSSGDEDRDRHGRESDGDAERRRNGIRKNSNIVQVFADEPSNMLSPLSMDTPQLPPSRALGRSQTMPTIMESASRNTEAQAANSNSRHATYPMSTTVNSASASVARHGLSAASSASNPPVSHRPQDSMPTSGSGVGITSARFSTTPPEVERRRSREVSPNPVTPSSRRSSHYSSDTGSSNSYPNTPASASSIRHDAGVAAPLSARNSRSSLEPSPSKAAYHSSQIPTHQESVSKSPQSYGDSAGTRRTSSRHRTSSSQSRDQETNISSDSRYNRLSRESSPDPPKSASNAYPTPTSMWGQPRAETGGRPLSPQPQSAPVYTSASGAYSGAHAAQSSSRRRDKSPNTVSRRTSSPIYNSASNYANQYAATNGSKHTRVLSTPSPNVQASTNAPDPNGQLSSNGNYTNVPLSSTPPNYVSASTSASSPHHHSIKPSHSSTSASNVPTTTSHSTSRSHRHSSSDHTSTSAPVYNSASANAGVYNAASSVRPSSSSRKTSSTSTESQQRPPSSNVYNSASAASSSAGYTKNTSKDAPSQPRTIDFKNYKPIRHEPYAQVPPQMNIYPLSPEDSIPKDPKIVVGQPFTILGDMYGVSREEQMKQIIYPSRNTPPESYRYRLRKGFWNQRGDTLLFNGKTVPSPPEVAYPQDLAGYPKVEDGYKNEYNETIPWADREEMTDVDYGRFIVYEYFQ